MLPLHQTLRLRSRTVPFLFKRSVLLIFAVTILNLVPPRGIEPRSEALQATAMTTSAKAANKTGCILLVRLKV